MSSGPANLQLWSADVPDEVDGGAVREKGPDDGAPAAGPPDGVADPGGKREAELPGTDRDGDDALLGALNPEQRRAVTHTGGPCLVLAGAGSGKTRVITHRIAWLIDCRDVDPSSVCAVTFTNKAAAEMRERVVSLLGRRPAGLWVLTFHALGLRLLRENAGAPGAPPAGFAVYDRDDALALWRRCQKALGIDLTEHRPERLHGRCSRAVNRLEDPAAWDRPEAPWNKRVAARVWVRYREKLREAEAVDFDDLLVRPLEMLSRSPDLRERYADRFRHLLVDEYQDTNRLQYRLVRTLIDDGGNLMVVGDEDQSIYRWRGAELANVLEFQGDFPDATVIRLERNYRSTEPILAAAGSLVAHNRERLGKELWTDRDGGDSPRYVECDSERDEARWVADAVAAELAETSQGPSGAEDHVAPPSIAILYRTNAQARAFEEELAAREIPYRVVGGSRFFARREVRDLLAWLRLLARPDDAALRRASGAPSRGIGPATLEALAAVRPDGNLADAFEALVGADDPAAALRDAGCHARGASALAGLIDLVRDLRERAGRLSPDELVRTTVELSGYDASLDDDPAGDERREVLEELANAAAEQAAGGGLDALAVFLDRVSLLTDADAGTGPRAPVHLMTLHAAKGLEFHTVYLTGMEEGLFPHASAVAGGQIEEERRLCYVGMTRARRRLVMTGARLRRVHGQERVQDRSRFIREIDPRHLVIDERPGASSGAGEGGRSSAPSRESSGKRRRKRGRSGGSRSSSAKSSGGSSASGAGDSSAAGRPAVDDELQPGVDVIHPMFGPGKVTGRQGAGEKLKLTIRFRRAGTKQILARYADLELA